MTRLSSSGIFLPESASSGGSSCRMAVMVSTADVARKGASARHHLVQHAAQRKNVAAAIDLLAADLLGRHVADGAQNRAGFRLGRRDTSRSAPSPDGDAGRSIRARPKSRTFTRPSAVRKMFSGFRSR